MVKVKPAMSTDSSEGESDALAAVKDKLKIQQRLIDISARSLLASRSSSADLSQSFESQSALEVQKENIALLENRLMKYFSRQLLLKHRFLQQVDSESPRQAERELNSHIDLGLFLSVADLEPRSIQLLLEKELALDVLFSMAPAQLQQLVTHLGLPVEEEGRLTTSLKLLSSCYHQQEKEVLDKATSERYLSTSSRLSSVSTLSSIDQEGRHDSWSSTANPSSAASITNAGSVFTLTSPRPYTASSTTHSLLSPSPCPVNGGPTHHSTPTPQSPTLSRNTSLSSSMLYSEPDSVDCLVSSVSSSRSHRRRYSHMRSHSNPQAHLIMPDGEQRTPAHPASRPEQAAHRSPSPPHHIGNQPSIAAHTTQGSPSTVHRRGYLQMRRLLPSSIPSSSDQLGPGGMVAAPESPIQKGPSYPEYPVRSNSVTYTDRRASSSSYQSQHQKLHHGVTSTSMVDLPNTYTTSTEHLDQIEEYPLSSNTAKSQSVPRLTFMTVSAESEKNAQSTSVPTSPRTPGTYTPTGHMGHAIKHRFTAKSFLTTHVCAVCKKTMVFGVRCKHCSYRCHKGCAEKAPHSCGLPRELMNFFRQQLLNKTSPSASFDNIISSTEPYSARPGMRRGSTYDADTRESEEDFIIPELTKEPTKGQYSPVMSQKKPPHASTENGRTAFTTQFSSPSLLEVPLPRSHHHGGFRSISSSPSPSSSPPTSPSLTPSSPRSPRSPNEPYNTYTYPKPPDVIYTDSENESCDGEPHPARTLPRSRSPTPFSSKDSISDMERMKSVSPKGLRPPPQVVPAHSLPDLLLGRKSLESSEDSSVGSSGYSDHQKVRKKESLLSATDSRGSTLVNSIPSQAEEEDPYTESYDSSQGPPDDLTDFKIRHRGSIVDEWNIPYDEVRIVERVGRGPMGEVSRGYWHGEVAIKKFCLDNATQEHLKKFREEVSILKKTRHTNLALFMGACLTLPNLAIITSFCRGHTLHKHLHIWSDVFSVERCINIGKQIATGMGYLHARGIVHKGLHTRNVFFDKDKVVITDTGLSSLSDSLSRSPTVGSGCRSVMSRTKLYYMAPELVREISTFPQVLENGDLFHYTEKTDVYAFGTVLYELLTRRYPFSSRDATGYPLTVTNLIYLVGRGCRQEISSREASKRLKDLIWDCWNPDPKLRVPFSTIWDILSKVSRKKTPIARSPSVPTALSRSSEDLLRLTFQ